MTRHMKILGALGAALAFGCSDEPSEDPTGEDNNGTGSSENNTSGVESLHPAFAEFDQENTDIYLDGDVIVIETNGQPNHVTPYWGIGHELYIEPTATSEERMTPSRIPDRDASTTMRIPLTPTFADTPADTQLGTIGISVSGAAIYNDQEGNGALDQAAGGLDYAGAHIGPSAYHYHLEPKPISDDDGNLIGVLQDGIFIYGRKDHTTGTYPTDLDEFGGHTGTTQHSDTPEYHYHVNTEFLDDTYILFPYQYRGTLGEVEGGEMGGGMGGGPGGGGPPMGE